MILCCGEALIDMIPQLSHGGREAFVPHVGGAIFNTAIALGRLDVPVAMLSGVSTDRFGQMLHAALEENRVATDLLIRSDRLTTLAVVHLVNGSASYSFYDESSAGRMLSPPDLPSLPAEVSALYLGGISLVAEPAADAYAALLERECGGRVVMMDPNIRPGFISDEIGYRNRLDRMLRHTDIVKVSDEDLRWLVADAPSPEAQARLLQEKGPRFVIVTQGAAGAFAVCPNTTVSVPGVPSECIDTVGAGDTFNAGMLAHLAKAGQLNPKSLADMSAADLKPALELGAKVAAVTVSRAGANPPWADEL